MIAPFILFGMILTGLFNKILVTDGIVQCDVVYCCARAFLRLE